MDLLLIGKTAPDSRELKLLEQFRAEIYESSFSGNEIEPFTEIQKRLGSGDDMPSYIVLCLDKDRVLGGLVADWYKSCSSLEIIYLVVRDGCRCKGIGGKLLEEGMPMILACIGTPRCTYFESEDPFFSDNSPNADRMRFFARHGAHRFPVDYVQPPLSQTQAFAYNLRLFCFPRYSDRVEEKKDHTLGLPGEHLKLFLKAFYDGLRDRCNEKGKLNDELDKMNRQIERLLDENDRVPLDAIQETAHFHIETLSIGSHFSYLPEPEEKIPFPLDADCTTFFSYETDLMDYSRQGEMRPFKTHHQLLLEDVVLYAPLFYEFTSEGRSCLRMPERREIEVDISLNWSYSPQESRGLLLHVVICPSKSGNYFTELEAIRLITAFGSVQEKFRCMDVLGNVTAEPWGGFLLKENKQPLLSWISDRLALKGTLKPTRTGISEIDLSGLKTAGNELLFENAEDNPAFDSFKSQITQKTLWNKTFCGIILGIFDFERMNTAEIYDTIRPMVVRPQSFVVLSRGHLVKIKGVIPGEDYERVENILISPYLLVPSTALAYNRLLLDFYERKVDSIVAEEKDFMDRPHRDRKYFEESQKIRRECSDITDALSENFLNEIFQYESEREILSTANRQRGLSNRFLTIQGKVDSASKEADHYYEEFQRGFDMNQNMILLVLAILEVVTAVLTGQDWWIMLTISSALLILFFINGRLLLRKTRKG